MALFQPTSVSPSENGSVGNGTVDITQDLQCSWQVNGSPPLLTKYKITIYLNDTASTQVYTTGELTNNCPFYGTDHNGDVKFFSHTIPAATLASAGMSNGNEYKLIIQQWWSDTGSVTQTSASVFITRAVPTISISNLPSPLTSRTFSFLAVYTQAQGDALTWVQWQLADATDTENPFLDTGPINTAQLQLDYDGFFTGNTYAIRCQIETENGILADTGWLTFAVSYASDTMDGQVTACGARNHSAVYLKWNILLDIPGAATGSYTISGSRITLPSGSSVLWNSVNGQSMSLAVPWSLIWEGSVNATDNATVLTMGALTIEFDAANKLYVKLSGTAIYTYTFERQDSDIFTVVITDAGIYVKVVRYTPGLYPHTGLYPHAGLYPQATHYTVFNDSAEVSVVEFSITSITIAGPCVCRYAYVMNGTLPAETITQIMSVITYTPQFTDSAYFLCDFKHELNAGNIYQATTALTKSAVYRKTSDQSTIQHIVDVPITEKREVLDYSAPSQIQELYYIFAVGDTTLSKTPYVSLPLTPYFWAWTVLECEADDDGVFHVLAEYQFKYNVNSGSISNNNSPELLENFTPHPLIQRKNTNYQSGTLTSLIGNVSKGQYSNTVKLKNTLTALSVTSHALFLKNRIGDLLRIRVSGAITMTTQDNTVEQIQTIALPWAESGSAEGVSIVSVPTDDFWPL